MDIKAARKQVQAPVEKNGNFMVVRFGYDNYLVLPYQEGLAMLAALESAEAMTDEYLDSKRAIVPLKRERITASNLSRHEYEQIKIANLLGVSIADLERHEEEELQQTLDQPAPKASGLNELLGTGPERKDDEQHQ